MLFRTLRTFLAPYVGLLTLVLFLSLASAITSLYVPTLNAALIDRGLAKGDIATIWRVGRQMLAVSALQGFCAIGSVYFGAKSAMSFGRDLRGAIFGKVVAFSGWEFSQFGAPSLITRTTNDVQQVQMLVLTACTILVSAPITMIGGVIMAVHEDAGLSWLLILAMPVLALPIGAVVLKLGPQFRLLQARIDVVNRVLREQIVGIRVVRAFVREPYERQRFASANAAVAEIATSAGQLLASFFPIVSLIVNVVSVGVLWFGAGRISAGHMQIGTMTAFLTYLIQILMSVTLGTFLLMVAPRAVVSAGRIQEVLNTRPSVAPPRHGMKLSGESKAVEFRRAQLTYPGADLPVVRDVSFVAKAGQTTAIIGATGSGKTTLVSLILRLFDVTGGEVLIDGVDVRNVDSEVLGNRIGLVPQRAYLFSGTVASNLRYGRPDATDLELWRALEVAQAAAFVRAMPGELQGVIAQGGSNISGGQRQRLAIARALVKRPSIYILDDPFSALDVATDSLLRSALKAETAQAVVIIVSQRVATIAGANHILVLEDGLVAGSGSHETLLETCATYREIVDSQLSADEAA